MIVDFSLYSGEGLARTLFILYHEFALRNLLLILFSNSLLPSCKVKNILIVVFIHWPFLSEHAAENRTTL